jgi:hypothetical protein
MSIFRRRRNHRAASDDRPDVEAARRDLERTQQETPMYAALGRSLRERRERNHLTQLFLDVHRER